MDFQLNISRPVQRFLERIADAREFLAFHLSFSRVLREPGGNGRREFSQTGERRSLHYSYYVSEMLQTVFVLMAYQERPSEPRESDQNEEKALLTAIHIKEASHENGLET